MGGRGPDASRAHHRPCMHAGTRAPPPTTHVAPPSPRALPSLAPRRASMPSSSPCCPRSTSGPGGLWPGRTRWGPPATALGTAPCPAGRPRQRSGRAGALGTRPRRRGCGQGAGGVAGRRGGARADRRLVRAGRAAGRRRPAGAGPCWRRRGRRCGGRGRGAPFLMWEASVRARPIHTPFFFSSVAPRGGARGKLSAYTHTHIALL